MLSAENRRSFDIKKLKHRHFERHTSTGSEIYSLLICFDAAKFVCVHSYRDDLP